MRKLLYLLTTIYSAIGYAADLPLSTSTDWRWVFHNTTYRSEPTTALIVASLIIAAASTATAIVQNNQRIDAAKQARDNAEKAAQNKRNALIQKQARARQQARGATALGGDISDSKDTSVLTQESSSQTSLLGG